MSHYYRKVPPSEVPAETREAAERALAHGRAELNLPAVLLRWIVPDDGGDIISENVLLGEVLRSDPSVIMVRADLPDTVMTTILHECRHIAQAVHGIDEPSEYEAAAEEYAIASMLRYSRDDEQYVQHLAELPDALKPTSSQRPTRKPEARGAAANAARRRFVPSNVGEAAEAALIAHGRLAQARAASDCGMPCTARDGSPTGEPCCGSKPCSGRRTLGSIAMNAVDRLSELTRQRRHHVGLAPATSFQDILDAEQDSQMRRRLEAAWQYARSMVKARTGRDL